MLCWQRQLKLTHLEMEVKQINRIAEVDSLSWNKLAGSAYPFLRHEFLWALEESASVCERSGWNPQHLLVMDGSELLACMPVYLKNHSRGEYVFDHQWAQAYQQSGRRYYPKWLTAIPFTPCQGPRIIIKDMADQLEVTQLLLTFIKDKSEQLSISSWHCLFPESDQVDQFRAVGLGIREGVQFQWFNKGYRDFDDFLQTLNSSKRKMIRRERRKVTEQNIELQQIPGHQVSEAQWQVFYKFYTMTYLKHGMQPYLNLAFFLACAETMGDRILLIMAVKDKQYVGAALSFIGADTLFGRYWGCYEEYDFLHFEACYYQGLDYCIAHGLQRFDSGAQGEHKIARGFEPITTYSAHWLKDPQFAKAIELFLVREQKAIEFYKQNAAAYLPFKNKQGCE
jgi:predicted N-acyltransferase